jgi:predicted  nucleic acid-binding Zn-ribbon protein
MDDQQAPARSRLPNPLAAVVAAAVVLVTGAVVVTIGILSTAAATNDRNEARSAHSEARAALEDAEQEYLAASDDIEAAMYEVMPDMALAEEVISIAEESFEHHERIVDIRARQWSAAAAGDVDGYNAAFDEIEVEIEALNAAVDRWEALQAEANEAVAVAR